MSESSRLSEALRKSEERFRLMVESVQDYAIFMLDPDGYIVSWNRGAERIKGYTEEEIVGKHFSIFYTDPDREREFPAHELVVAAREGRFEDEGWRVRKDGSLLWASVVITALHDEETNELVGFGKVTRDLTERVQAAGERRALEREREARRLAEDLAEEVRIQTAHLEVQAVALEAVNESLVRANSELQAQREAADRLRNEAEMSSRAKTDFLANMSHELRTPMNAIVGYTDLIELGIAGPVTDAQRAQLERIRVSSQHLLMLVDDILDLAKIEAGRVEIGREPCLVREVVDAGLSLIRPQAAARDLEIVNQCEFDAELRYLGDEDRVRQILVNLLSNAVKFTDAGGTVTIRCEAATAGVPIPHAGARPFVAMQVADTGIGIPEDHLETVFEPFVQVETGRTRTHGGTGLGLAISRQLARLMGGDLTVTSEMGAGSCFTLWLPAAT